MNPTVRQTNTAPSLAARTAPIAALAKLVTSGAVVPAIMLLTVGVILGRGRCA